MSNPLLHIEGLPPFSQIKPEHIQPAIQELIEENRQVIEQVLKQPHFTWENFIEPLSEAGEHLSRAWSPISHLNSVKNSPKLRDAYQACLPLLSEYSTWVGQHKGLY
ncbi:MAG: oligopeptidase A, partial [Haemophilus parainfluenzae]|nr:oligopeptidase A [Haemophilus parainfluenzae]